MQEGDRRLMARKKTDQLFIRVHENMPEHPKIEPLSDRAFRLIVETWCWCARNRTDGHVPVASWLKRGTAKARAELVAAGLVDDDLTGGVIVHDYDDWQRTAAEINAASEVKSAAGSEGAHIKWHVRRGEHQPSCTYCQTDSKAIAGAINER
jgi:hypothetical protein